MTYRIMIAISESMDAESWVQMAQRLIPDEGKIRLRGMITIPEGHSLSEGAIKAQQLRDRFDALIETYPSIQQENWVRVGYDPYDRILTEMIESPVDLLISEWHGPYDTTGGIPTDRILQHAPCDVVLISSEPWNREGPVMVTLHGGPNMTLAMQMAHALTPAEQISLLHASDNPQDSADLLHPLLGTEGGVSRVVTLRSEMDLKQSIIQEARGHKTIIMGASFYRTVSGANASGEIVERIFESTEKPLVLVRAYQPVEKTAEAVHAPRFIPRSHDVSTRVDRWFAENSFDAEEFADLESLLGAKERQGLTISIGLPAYNEEETVANVINIIRSKLVEEVPLIDEIAVIDGGSTDRTAEIVESLGVPLYKSPEVLVEDVGFVPGKGEALWKSLHVLNGDIIAWIDTDIKNIHPRFIYGIVGPLIRHPHIQYVKGFYHRPIKIGDQIQAYGGGRVTELVARPLLNLFYPELSGVVQPLAGEYAGRRSALERVPFFSGYGVETGLLIDLHELFGLDAIAQTNLKERVHHNQPLGNLSRMSFAILQVFMSRIEQRYGVQLSEMMTPSMKTIVLTPERLALNINEISDTERPAMIDVPSYQRRRQKVGSPGD